MCSKWKQIELAGDNSQGINKITSIPGVAKGHCNKRAGMAEGARWNGVPHTNAQRAQGTAPPRRVAFVSGVRVKHRELVAGAQTCIHTYCPRASVIVDAHTHTHIHGRRRTNRIMHGYEATAGWVLSQLFCHDCHDCRNVYCILFNYCVFSKIVYSLTFMYLFVSVCSSHFQWWLESSKRFHVQCLRMAGINRSNLQLREVHY